MLYTHSYSYYFYVRHFILKRGSIEFSYVQFIYAQNFMKRKIATIVAVNVKTPQIVCRNIIDKSKMKKKTSEI